MPGSRISSTVGSPKPDNVFYIWYTELCRRTNTTPLAIVKPPKPKNDSVLDFVSDRIKAEEWLPILNALRNDTSLHVIAIRSRIECKFLREIDTEDKVKSMTRKFGSLWTGFFLNSLIQSLICCIVRSRVLTCLELDGLPITTEYLQFLLEGLKKNKTIRILSFKHCQIRDIGCQELCSCLRNMPNIEVLNLTSCNLGTASAEALAKVIRCQQINRYCESWHSSLRYEDPEVGAMAGLKRITLNNNPHIGDEGLQLILNELDDDLWIKAVDMQRCNITENIAGRLLDVIDYSRSLEIADFRYNDHLSFSTIEKIFNVLKTKQRFGYETEYQWCLSSTTLPYENSTYELFTSSNISSSLQKSISAPFNDTKSSTRTTSDCNLKRTKTSTFINKPSTKLYTPNRMNVSLARKEVMQLNAQLQEEITKRIQTEKQNECLKQKLNEIKCKVNNTRIITNPTGEKSEVKVKAPNFPIIPKTSDPDQAKPIFKVERSISNESHVILNAKKQKIKFICSTEGKNRAQNLFKNLVNKNSTVTDYSDDEDLISEYFAAGDNKSNSLELLPKIEEDELEYNSNASLIMYAREIQRPSLFKTMESPSKNEKCDNYKILNKENGFKKAKNRSVTKQVQNPLKVSPVR